MNHKTVKSGGIGFISLLTLIFIVLKLTNNISWSWYGDYRHCGFQLYYL